MWSLWWCIVGILAGGPQPLIQDTFDHRWQSRWSVLTGSWEWRGPQGNPHPTDAQKCISPTRDGDHTLTRQIPPRSTQQGSGPLILHAHIRLEWTLEDHCSSAFIRLYDDQGVTTTQAIDDFTEGRTVLPDPDAPTPPPRFLLQFGPMLCGEQNKSALLVHFGNKTAPLYIPLVRRIDKYFHQYTLKVLPDNTFVASVDGRPKAAGSLTFNDQDEPDGWSGSVRWVTPTLLTNEEHLYRLGNVRTVVLGAHSRSASPTVPGEAPRSPNKVLFHGVMVSTEEAQVEHFGDTHFTRGPNPTEELSQECGNVIAFHRREALPMAGEDRMPYATVLIASKDNFRTCAVISKGGYILCSGIPGQELSEDGPWFAVVHVQARQKPMLCYTVNIALRNITEQWTMFRYLSYAWGKYSDVDPLDVGAIPTTPVTHPKCRPDRKILIHCMAETSQSYREVKTIDAVVMGCTSRSKWSLQGPPRCQGGVVYTSQGGLLGITLEGEDDEWTLLVVGPKHQAVLNSKAQDDLRRQYHYEGLAARYETPETDIPIELVVAGTVRVRLEGFSSRASGAMVHEHGFVAFIPPPDWEVLRPTLIFSVFVNQPDTRRLPFLMYNGSLVGQGEGGVVLLRLVSAWPPPPVGVDDEDDLTMDVPSLKLGEGGYQGAVSVVGVEDAIRDVVSVLEGEVVGEGEGRVTLDLEGGSLSGVGAPVVDLEGRLVGLWDGEAAVPVGVVRTLLNQALAERA